jgi:hypothetical protein
MSVKPKLFRDPVHDTIALAQDGPEARLILALLDTPEMQRLRRVRQLGLTSMVYPGAEHSRFQHSLGVLWTAHEMLQRLEKRAIIAPELRTLVLAGALLHDVGHGPMSHALEAVTKVKHERWTEAFIGGKTLTGEPHPSGVSRVLEAYAPGLGDKLVALYGKGPLPDGVPPFARDIVSSQLDADRLDYILRDGHHTGVRIGNYDLARILALVDLADGHLAIHVGALEAVEGYLLARFHMYKQVYLHKTSRTAEKMLEAMLKRARSLRIEGSGPAYWPEGALGTLILGDELTPSAFATLDDADIAMAMKRWANDPDRWLAELAGGLVDRRLYKALPLPNDKQRADELVHAAEAVARVHGFLPEATVLVDSSRDSLYRPFTGSSKDKLEVGESIRLVEGASTGPWRVTFIEERSEVVRMLANLEVRQRLLCVHPTLKEPVARALGRR